MPDPAVRAEDRWPLSAAASAVLADPRVTARDRGRPDAAGLWLPHRQGQAVQHQGRPSTKRKPQGCTCKRYGAETKLKFRCARGIENFFAIKR